MGTEETWNVALENHNLGFVIDLEPLHHVGHSILEILPPKIDFRIRVGEGDFEYTAILDSL